MGNFEEKRREYIARLKEQPKVLKQMLEAGIAGEEQTEDSLKAIIFPEDEKELVFADCTYTMTYDLMELAGRAIAGAIKEIPYEENHAVRFIVDTINAIQDTGNLDALSDREDTPEEAARVLYDFTVLIADDPRAAMEYVGEQTGFDLEDEHEFACFKIYMDRASDAIKEMRPDHPKKPFRECTVEDLAETQRFTNAFHERFEEQKKEPDIEDMGKMLLKLFKRAMTELNFDDDDE